MLCYTCLWSKYLKFLIGISSFSTSYKWSSLLREYVMECATIVVVPYTPHHRSINILPNQARLVALMCIQIDCAFPPLTIVLHMTFEQHIPLIIIKKLCGGPFEGHNAHSCFSGSNGYIAVNIHIENTNVVCLFFWIFSLWCYRIKIYFT